MAIQCELESTAEVSTAGSSWVPGGGFLWVLCRFPVGTLSVSCGYSVGFLSGCRRLRFPCELESTAGVSTAGRHRPPASGVILGSCRFREPCRGFPAEGLPEGRSKVLASVCPGSPGRPRRAMTMCNNEQVRTDRIAERYLGGASQKPW